MQAYQESEGLSKHKLDWVRTAPAYYKWRLQNQTKPSRSMELGTLVHELALEDKRNFAVAPAVDRRTKEGKADWQKFCEDNIGKLVITEEEASIVEGASAAVQPLLSKFTYDQDGGVELSMYWERNGIQCKGRADLVGRYNGSPCIVDLKTVTRISNFDRSFFEFRYDTQAEWYRYGYKQIFNDHPTFMFLVVDMEAPHLTQIVMPSSELLAQANTTIEEDLAQYKICTELDVWPGLPETRIIMPRW